MFCREMLHERVHSLSSLRNVLRQTTTIDLLRGDVLRRPYAAKQVGWGETERSESSVGLHGCRFATGAVPSFHRTHAWHLPAELPAES